MTHAAPRPPFGQSPATPLEEAWAIFAVGDVWARPGLDRRSRYIIAVTAAADMGGPDAILDNYVRSALREGALTLVELREIALQMTGYAGFSQATRLDAAITRMVQHDGLEEPPFRPLRPEPLSPAAREAKGREGFRAVVPGSDGPPASDAFLSTGILDYVFADLWTRSELDVRSRRLVALVCAADTQAPNAVRTHVHAALASGDLSRDEMEEFVLQYAVHGGHTRGSTMEELVTRIGAELAGTAPPR